MISFQVRVDLPDVWLWLPAVVPIDDVGDLDFLYFDTESRYLDVPVFFDPSDPVGL